tara:strand:- start:1796 stop:2011 length:216 start_codon:yes stop_codon:yes gene_type:complete
MKWIGYTTHHLWGNIAILLLIILMWWFNKNKSNFNTSWREFITIIIIIAFSLTLFYAIYLGDNPTEVIKLF